MWTASTCNYNFCGRISSSASGVNSKLPKEQHQLLALVKDINFNNQPQATYRQHIYVHVSACYLE